MAYRTISQSSAFSELRHSTSGHRCFTQAFRTPSIQDIAETDPVLALQDALPKLGRRNSLELSLEADWQFSNVENAIPAHRPTKMLTLEADSSPVIVEINPGRILLQQTVAFPIERLAGGSVCQSARTVY